MNQNWQIFLEQRGAVLVDGGVAHFGNPEAELAAAHATTHGSTLLCDLSHQGLLLAAGDDAQTFLHGQLTNDVAALTDDNVQRNGYCSPKGRLLATFLMWKAKQGYLLQLPPALLAPIQKRLAMFVLRAKVKFEDVSDQWVTIGVAGPNAEAGIHKYFGQAPAQPMSTWHGDAVRVMRLEGKRFQIIGAPEKMPALWDALSESCVKVGSALWGWLDIQAGIAQVLPATQEAFVPQMANYELTGGVSFKKGCYPGQEIVARTQYRGILKRRMALAHLDGVALPQPGDKDYSAQFADQAAGEIANAAASPEGGFDLLVVAQIESIQGGELHWKTPDGPVLKLLPLPYSMPE